MNSNCLPFVKHDKIKPHISSLVTSVYPVLATDSGCGWMPTGSRGPFQHRIYKDYIYKQVHKDYKKVCHLRSSSLNYIQTQLTHTTNIYVLPNIFCPSLHLPTDIINIFCPSLHLPTDIFRFFLYPSSILLYCTAIQITNTNTITKYS